MIGVQGPLVLLLRVPNLTPRLTLELDHLRPYPISKLPSLRPECQSETTHLGLILPNDRQGPTAATGFSEVSSFGSGSPQSSLRVPKLKLRRSWASSLCSPEDTPPLPGPQFL